MWFISRLALLLVAFAAVGCSYESGSIETCTPGEMLDISCDGTLGIRCDGDPALSICDAAIVSSPERCSVSSAGVLAFDDDGGEGDCPFVRGVTCPASGRIAIDPDPSVRGGLLNWSCDYSVRRGTPDGSMMLPDAGTPDSSTPMPDASAGACSDARLFALTAGEQQITGDTTDASADRTLSEGCGGESTGQELLAFQIPGSGQVGVLFSLATDPTDFDTTVEVRPGGCDDVTEALCFEDVSRFEVRSEGLFLAEGGETVYVVVTGYDARSFGPWAMDVTVVPNVEALDLTRDPNNCGMVGNDCFRTEYCVGGMCQCRPGLTRVSMSCVDLQTDPRNCGVVGMACSGATPNCSGGVCVGACPAGLDSCYAGVDGSGGVVVNECVDFDTDPSNCGGCGNGGAGGGGDRCAADQVCVAGNCENFELGLGCTMCPCDTRCVGDFTQCCAYPGTMDVVCVDAGACP